ncbi:MAG TPA: alpha/beta hydrolase [Chitinophagaceae bacterium]|nr:alpha/beta hydrolase [Chitinophagaceae bacterium]
MKYVLVLFSFLWIGCQKEEQPGPNPGLPEKTLTDIAYGGQAAQKMDIYLPANRSIPTTGVIILIHGGAWTTGDKSEFTEYVDTLKRRLPGYAIFNINYRLSVGGINTFPAQENDVKAAVEFIYSKRAEYQVSEKFALLGASAGAHLALLQGYKYSSPVRVKAIVDFFGPVDMVDLYNNPASPLIPSTLVASIVGATPVSDPTLYQQSSPLNFVNAQSPPTLILQGGLDPLVAVSQSESLRDKLQAMGVVNQYFFYPLEGHGWVGANLTHSFDQVQAFLSTYLN